MNKHNLSISNFRINIIFFLKLLLLFLGCIAYINHVLPQYTTEYNASLIDKVERLSSINEPKIVLIGNSNVAFGINSKLIEDAFGMPVVNMGLHGGAGNVFHEEMAKINVTPGDIYIICHSNYNDNNKIADGLIAWISIENHFKLWKLIRMEDMETMANSFPVYLKKSLDLYSSGKGNQEGLEGIRRNSFNEYGDVDTIREENLFTFEKKVIAPTIANKTMERINELNSYLLQKNATLLVAGYPIGKGSLTESDSEFIAFQNQLSNELDCPVISNYIDYMFEYQYFYNTELHLTSEGAELRTNQLISDIKKWKESS